MFNRLHGCIDTDLASLILDLCMVLIYITALMPNLDLLGFHIKRVWKKTDNKHKEKNWKN